MEIEHPSQDQKYIQQLQEEDIVRQSNQIQPEPELPESQPTEGKSIHPEQTRKKRKRSRMRQLEQREAQSFIKRPSPKPANHNKDLKRAYQKGFFDDSKFDFIRSLRKIRKNPPEQDSVSSHYGSDDQSFDINDALPKRGFQRKKIISQNDGQISSSDSEAPKQKKISKPRKPRKPKQQRALKPREPHQPRKKRQLRTNQQEKELIKKQPKKQESKPEQQIKQIARRSGVQIRYTKAPAQMPKKSSKKDDSENSLDQSQSEFKSSEGSKSQQQIIVEKIRQIEQDNTRQKQQNKINYSKKQQLAQKVNRSIEQSDKLRISVQQTKKILSQPQKVQIVNLNTQLPLPLISNKYLPPNIAARKEQQFYKIPIKKLLPQQSKNDSSESQSSDSSSQSSSSSGSSSSDQEQSKSTKQNNKRKKNQANQSEDSQKDKKKKHKKRKKNRQSQSESILTKLIKDDNFRKLLVKQKQKEAQKKLKNLKNKEKIYKQDNKVLKNQEAKKIQSVLRNEAKQVKKQKPAETRIIEIKSNILSSSLMQQQKNTRINQQRVMKAQKQTVQIPQNVDKTNYSKRQFGQSKKQSIEISKQNKKNLNYDKSSKFKLQSVSVKVESLEKFNKKISNETLDKPNLNVTYKKQKTQDLEPPKKVQQIKPLSIKNLKQKSKKFKNLSMENNVVGLKLSIGKDKPQQTNKKVIETKSELKLKDQKLHKTNRIIDEQVKLKQRVEQSQVQLSSDNQQARYYKPKHKYKHVPRKVVRYRKVIVQRSQSSDSSESSDSYPKKRVIRRVKRKYSDSQQSESEQQPADYRVLDLHSRKGQKIKQVIKKR